ncbi:MAG: hypothetical protein LBJ03_01330 [Holosporales bacterium]|jgi:putative ABC transport system permease protein|nr:hypothetical protein [Holosporales bacterium]
MIIPLQELITSAEIGLIFGSVAIGIYLTFRAINFADLTCDGSFVLGAAVAAVLARNGFDPYLALFCSALLGSFAGLITGVLNVKFGISDLLSGIIVAFVLYSVNLRIMGSAPNVTFEEYRNTLFVVAPLALGLAFLLASGFGLKLRAVGYSQQFAITFGTNVGLMTIVGLMLSNAMISLGGGLFSQYQGFCDVSQGVGTLVAGLASVIIGEKVLPFKKAPYLIISCVIGSILYRIFISIALHSSLLGIKTQDLNLITGLIIVLVMLTRRKARYA